MDGCTVVVGVGGVGGEPGIEKIIVEGSYHHKSTFNCHHSYVLARCSYFLNYW